MAGESTISVGAIEKKAEDLETKVAAEKAEAEKAEADTKAAADKAEADKVAAAEAEKNKNIPTKKEPNDPVELRKWATRTSMELAEVKKQQEALLAAFNKTSKKQIDWKELAKDPAKLEKAVDEVKKEMAAEYEATYTENLTKATADIANLEDKVRYHDSENYPLWADLKPIMLKLSEPNQSQPNGDPRINFNQHPKLVLDDLYELAKQIAAADPNFKKPAAPAAGATGKSFTQEELEAKVAEVKKQAFDEAQAALRKENGGAGVGSMGKGSSKGKPGEVDKAALWDMPLNDLGNAVKSATEKLR